LFRFARGQRARIPFRLFTSCKHHSIPYNHHASRQNHRSRSHQLSSSSLAADCHPAHCTTLVYVLPPFQRVALRIPIHLQHVLHLKSSCQLTIRGRRRTKHSGMDWQYASRLSGIPRSSRCKCIGRFSFFLSSCSLCFPVRSRSLFPQMSSVPGTDFIGISIPILLLCSRPSFDELSTSHTRTRHSIFSHLLLYTLIRHINQSSHTVSPILIH
jgi:hypothetical protein